MDTSPIEYASSNATVPKEECPVCLHEAMGDNSETILQPNELASPHLQRDLICFDEPGACSNATDDAPPNNQELNSLLNEATEEIESIVGMCPHHVLPFSFVCLTCDVWGCPSCSTTDHQESPSGLCTLMNPDQALKFLKRNTKHHVDNIRRSKKKIDKETSCLTVIADYYKNQAAQIKAQLDRVKKNLEELNNFDSKNAEMNCEVVLLMRNLKEAYEKVKHSNNPDTMTCAMNAVQNCEVVMSKYASQDLQAVSLLPEIKVHKVEEIVGLLETGAPLYGLLKKRGIRTYAELTLQEGHILLHCLRTDVYPNEGVAVLTQPFASLRELVPKESATIFFDIGWAGQKRGRMYVQLFGHTPRGSQALMLCSGEKGPSYRNTIFYETATFTSWFNSRRQDILYGGDYEKNDGSGGCAIEENITDKEDYQHSAIRQGMVIGFPSHEYWRLAGFKVYLEDDSNASTDFCFGIVTQGLGILRAAAKQVPVTSSYVCDCGLVIPLDS